MLKPEFEKPTSVTGNKTFLITAHLYGLLIQDDQIKEMLLSHLIKLVFFIQIQNRFGFCKYSLGDARSIT